jgi:catechol 2,3-dioxygenase-like lactoylglutathione lyase family enzyme/predicted kinase
MAGDEGGAGTPTPLIIVTGPPASGKTALARRLADELRLPRLSRDDLKERLFDTLGWDDREWSKRLGAASYELVWQILESHLAAGSPLLVESNFRGTLPTERFRELGRRHPFTPHQVNCVADGATLVERYRERAHSPERHPGHGEEIDDELREQLERGRLDPLPIGGEIIEVDTTDPEVIDYEGLLRRLRAALAGEGRPAATGDQSIRLVGLEGLVLTVRDLAATRGWYARVLGMEPITFEGGRVALAFGGQKINLHEAGREFEPKAAHPTPGSADLCFLTATPLATFLAHLEAAGVPAEAGPVRRVGARGPLRSVYLRDPDGNLIEVANQTSGEDGDRTGKE